MLTIYYVIISLAIATMLGALVMVIRLQRIARGGLVGRVVKMMIGFIVLFLAGYAAGPFLPGLNQEIGLILTAVVFLFGAIFVVLVLWLIRNLVRQVFEELEL